MGVDVIVFDMERVHVRNPNRSGDRLDPVRGVTAAGGAGK